jgi:hypothetical protein
VLSFLHFAFIEQKERIISEPILVSKLEDLLYSIRLTEGEGAYPKAAHQYLEDWADVKKGWLRKFYQKGNDEPFYDLTPATEKAIRWVESLYASGFVGTESRLLTLFDLLRQMVQGTEQNAAVRIEELEKQKRGLELQIEALKRGELEIMGDAALKDRFFQFSSTARELLSDFRQVEYNFRQLDTEVREKIATWEGNKGDLLQAVFGERDAITGSDQGQSFAAFWDFLMSAGSQEEFSTMLEKVLALEGVQLLENTERLRDIHYQWLDAGEQTQKTVATLSMQLRRFLDNQTWLENRRIMQLVDSITRKAITIKNLSDSNESSVEKSLQMQLNESHPSIAIPLDRPLFGPKEQVVLQSEIQEAVVNNTDASALFKQVYVDKEVLKRNIRSCLQKQTQVSLKEVTEHFPLQKGLSELVAYLSLAQSTSSCLLQEDQTESIHWGNRVTQVPLIIFTRGIA